MTDKVTLDFVRNEITWDTDAQKGTEFYADLAALKPKILSVLGYETVDMRPAVNAINAFINGEIDEEEFVRQCDVFVQDDKEV